MDDLVVPGSFRPTTPRAVWVTNYGEVPRHGLLLAWRRQRLPSVADQQVYWFGLVLMARWFGESLETQTKWCWEAYLVPAPARPVYPERTKAPASRS